MRIQNNTAAFNVWSNYTTNLGSMQSSMNKLSTGVISVVDDPAGVGISERMRAQAAGTSMARNNVDNGISMIQTADGWLQKVNDMLSRMNELAIEGNDGTKSSQDVANVNTEFKQMQEEITRITSKYTAAAKFNGLYLFRGGNGVALTSQPGDKIEQGKIDIQVGPDVDQTIELSMANLEVTNTENIGTVATYRYNSSNIVTSSSRTEVTWGSIIDVNHGISLTTDEVIGKLAKAIDFVANARASLGAQQKRMEQTASALLSYEDNLRAAESKIRDIDMARESTNFTKYQVLTNAGNAMLVQANQLPQSVLQLLG